MSRLTIIANITANSEKIDLVGGALQKLIAPSRADAGCVHYDLYQDNENPAHFMFCEAWESRELWLAHMETPHLAAFKAATEGAIEAITINEMSQVG